MGHRVQSQGKQQSEQLWILGRHLLIHTLVHQMLLMANQDESQMNHLSKYFLFGNERCVLSRSTH